MLIFKIFVCIILINVIITLFALLIAGIKEIINNKLHSISCFANYISNNEYVMQINLSKFCEFEPDLILHLKYIEDDKSFEITKIVIQKIRNMNKINDILKSLSNVYYHNKEAIINTINKLQEASCSSTSTIIMRYKYNNSYEIRNFQIIIEKFGPIVIEYEYKKDGESI